MSDSWNLISGCGNDVNWFGRLSQPLADSYMTFQFQIIDRTPSMKPDGSGLPDCYSVPLFVYIDVSFNKYW